MNILFCYDSPFSREFGGVSAVSLTIMQGLSERGHICYGLSIHRTHKTDGVWGKQFYMPEDNTDYKNKTNKRWFNSFVKEKKIDIIINQNGISRKSEWPLMWGHELGIRVLTVYHNSLFSLFSCQIKKIIDNKLVRFFYLRPTINSLWRRLYRCKYRSFYRRGVQYSNKVVLLSPNYFRELEWFSGVKISDKYVAIPNPAMPRFNVDLKCVKKEDVALFVGRMAEQKRLDYLLDIWEKVSPLHPSWKLYVVGDGELREQLENRCSNNHIPRVCFEGHQDPLEYYKRTKIFCMTSSFEGFPGVLTESMACGCVPIIFNSFACAPDIIDNDENGILIKPFNTTEYVSHLDYLMRNEDYRAKLAINAKMKSTSFSLEKVVEMWESLFL